MKSLCEHARLEHGGKRLLELIFVEAGGAHSCTNADRPESGEYRGQRVNLDPPAYVTTPLTMIPETNESK